MSRYLMVYGIFVGVFTTILVVITALLYFWDLLKYIAEYNLFLSCLSGIGIAGVVLVAFVYIEERWGI